ncbi:uncharacterized protein [Dermacentor andersoni]|uniref:uncharacterized protein isoform X1 n=2 Tax=Dermacentor andersoni TaxID=34620 RepID=UPI0024173AEB|nr:uncharacterized protein LOC129381953 isoform X1 [Dermacentor andersoni]
MKLVFAAIFLLSTCCMRGNSGGWGCPDYPTICDFLCKVRLFAFGYCDNQEERDGCHCVNASTYEIEDGGLSQKYLNDSGRYVKVLEGHGCPKIFDCAIVCLLNGGEFAICSKNLPYHCYCYLKLGSAAPPTATSTTTARPSTVQPSVYVRNRVCPKGGPICELYCQLEGSPFGYCLPGESYCHCVSPELRVVPGADTSYKYYYDNGSYVKELKDTHGCPRLHDCAVACLTSHRADHAVCGRNPPHRCYCYISRHKCEQRTVA